MEKRKFLFEEINKIEISLSEEQINHFAKFIFVFQLIIFTWVFSKTNF